MVQKARGPEVRLSSANINTTQFSGPARSLMQQQNTRDAGPRAQFLSARQHPPVVRKNERRANVRRLDAYGAVLSTDGGFTAKAFSARQSLRE